MPVKRVIVIELFGFFALRTSTGESDVHQSTKGKGFEKNSEVGKYDPKQSHIIDRLMKMDS